VRADFHSVTWLIATVCVAHLWSLRDVRPGLEYDFRGTSIATSAGGKPVANVIIRGHAQLLENKLRVDLEKGGLTTTTMVGYYLVALADGERLLWVNPSERTFYEVTADLGNAGIILPLSGEQAPPKLSNVHISAERLGGGPNLQGYATIHYRFFQEMNLQTNASTIVIHNRFSVDYYFPEGLPNFTNPLMFRAVFFSPSQLPEDYMRAVRSEVAKLPKLAPLRSVYQDESVDPSAGTTMETTTTTFEVVNLRTSNISPDVFDVPAGFEKIQPPHRPAVDGKKDNREP
jgi:hypothetical protein